MRKKKRVKKHTVSAQIQVVDLTKAGSSIDFIIRANNEVIGKIVLGHGSLTWYGRRRQRGKRMSWSQFAEFMDEYTYGA